MPTELLKLDLGGFDQVTASQAERLARLKDLSPVFEWADLPFRLEVAEQFKTQGAYFENGSQWAPLSPEYARRKPTPPAPFGILYRSGELFRSLSEEGGEHVSVATADSGLYGSTVEYGKYHQTGATWTNKAGVEIRLPQRRILDQTFRWQRFRQQIVRAVIGYVLRGTAPTARG